MRRLVLPFVLMALAAAVSASAFGAREETHELQEHLKEFPAPGPRPSAKGVAGAGRPQIQEDLRQRLEDEVGDLFFVLVNIARYLSLDPESALRRTNRKFKRRFQWMEERLRASGRAPQEMSMAELESLWQEAKRQELEGEPRHGRDQG